MSDNENKPRILRTSAGKTRLTAGSSDTGQSQSGATENKREASSAGGGQPAKPQQPAKSQQAGQTAQPKTTTQAQTPAKAGSGGQAGKPAGQQEQPVKAQPAKPAQAPAAGTDSASTSGSGKSGAGDSSATGTDASKANSSGVRSTSQGVRLGGSKSDAGQTQVVATSGGAGSAGSAGGGTGGVAGGRGSEAPTQQGSGPDTSRDRGGESQPSSQAQRGSAPTQVGGVGAVAGAGAGASAAGGAATSASANQSGSGPDHSNVAKTSGAKKSKDGVRASSAGVKMKGNKKSGPRSVNLTVASVDLWSVSKMTLLLSVALGIATIVAFIILWLVLQATGTLESIRGTMGEIAGPESAEEMLKLLGFGPVVSFAVILAVVNVVLMTALATLFGFLYNIGSSMVGGFRLTLVDD
ncbi:DUF3566 domain-containing protein [Brevibacterium sp. UMB1308A]|uniref:DUF3566 domain-containing protein n=1 Tax=Brevibacterium sp. UMB1308A TaxID=3050608 RepID=UPI00254A6912|nr:DUF3566 domain-containing protein [Brevibacterium sp. UMB1308A]MDK8346121.1 DUF3566 domain-containing protein [Brevibacterium sp. UMB1308B]MDK8713124.1 DUF3566 domain-containing protein [Brevibacterium sp. UMB1308A]